jgi:hypothetical protein
MSLSLGNDGRGPVVLDEAGTHRNLARSEDAQKDPPPFFYHC